jgi:hypothetical protein
MKILLISMGAKPAASKTSTGMVVVKPTGSPARHPETGCLLLAMILGVFAEFKNWSYRVRGKKLWVERCLVRKWQGGD